MSILLGLKADRVCFGQEVAVAVPAHLVSHGDGDGGDWMMVIMMKIIMMSHVAHNGDGNGDV